MRQIITYSFFLLLLSCAKEDTTSKPYNVNGRVINNSGIGMEGVSIAYGDAKSVTTDAQGYWMINDLIDENTFTPALNNFTFNPTNIKVSASINGVLFIGTEKPSTVETQIFNWFNAQQLPNGLLESVENGNIVSLYDNALAALVFLTKNDIAKAEKYLIFLIPGLNRNSKKELADFHN
ncbi:MAG: carboxypeptidase regulatory-like domain-containing protein [Saprospiraceae bacterium]|nr:carboxypeptidase regulatory-like domain-containing protein [Candidatus Brachybacter algidus]